MFSNGSEYTEFMAKNCDDCPHFVEWDEATKEKPVCHVEDAISNSMADESKFPYTWLDENPHMSRYNCRKKAGLPERVKVND